MKGLIIAIKDNGFLAVSCLAAPICVLLIRMCRNGAFGMLTLSSISKVITDSWNCVMNDTI